MALPTTVVVPISQDRATASRSNSLVSTASSGGASLRRRSRTRTRTLTGGRRPKSLGRSAARRGEGHDESPYGGIAPPTPKGFSDESQDIAVSSHPGTPTQLSHTPRRPKTAGSERRPSLEDKEDKGASSSRVVRDDVRGRQTKSEGGSVRGVKTRLRGMSLPRQAFKVKGSSGSSSQPSPTAPGEGHPEMSANRAGGSACRNFRDSVLTQHSSTSSSLYPASTYSGSQTESSLLPSSFDGDEQTSAFSPEIVLPGNPEFDADDVSYRLRLLVNNSYFLPPAHAKPSPMSLVPMSPSKKTQGKQTNATFLDFFRIGKSKSKPTTPVLRSPPALDQSGPILRTTSDSTTASGYVPRPHASLQPQTPTPPVPNLNAMNRVVVLRERMQDLATAAKEAEQDIKSRADVRRTKSQTTPHENDLVDDVIDPTDAVDLPPSLEDYPFAVQASAAFGLGVRESVGAAVLAEQLPPSRSPGDWSSSTEDDSWRKELLREAITHSLNSASDHSFLSSPEQSSASPTSPTTTSTTESRAADSTFTLSSTSTPRRGIGRPILQHLTLIAEIEQQHNSNAPKPSPNPPHSTATLSPTQRTLIQAARRSWLSETVPPARAETPSEPLPLAPPPPRRQLINPLYSLSQPDLSESNSRDREQVSVGSSEAYSSVVRKAVSSPRLSAVHERANVAQRTMFSISPPPLSIHQITSSRSSPALQVLGDNPSFSSYRSFISGSRLSDDDLSYATPMDTDGEESAPRASVSVSLFSGDRPSISEYSPHSPAASAFRDAVFGSCRSPSPYARRSINENGSGPSRVVSPLRDADPEPRSAAMSPPPRVSSSLGPTVLPPPPRSPAVKPLYRPSTPSHASSEAGHRSFTSVGGMPEPSVDKASMESFIHPAPAVPISDRRGLTSLSLRIPTEDVASSIHSAPAPASPTAFFDRIQSHHNAMDDLDTSDESEDEEDTHPPPPPPMYAEPRIPRTPTSSHRVSSVGSRPSIMRLGNHSTPHLRPPNAFREGVSYDVSDRKKPIGNVPETPPRASFFSVRKRLVGGTDAPLFPFAPQHTPSSRSRSLSRRPATAEGSRSRRWQRESLQKFDGMLLQHMQAERDRIKQITSNISGSRN
ncbi:hypothetical protein BKA93DRAFT_829546 [Sparassis latifolia]|uniref:Uncharacterized protein n=1 Tax=Sparassis crispa TaxID=139825 RepID=A0A401H095_9APHY|nr:predicted protein [Sparassis crispa]GBE87810.1 predicted protein [Sparassis crispa]